MEASNDWNITDMRYVACIDIMGFKDMVARKKHQQVYEMLKRVAEAVKSIELLLKNFHSEDLDDFRVTLYSDSILVFSRDASYDSREIFVAAVANLAHALFQECVPFKGAIAFGEMTLDYERSIFFGQPLIDAHLMQEELGFYGVVVHATAENEDGHNIDEDHAVLEYNTPFKSGAAKHLTIMPGITFIETYEKDILNEVKDNVLRMRFNTSGSLRKYIDNTLGYLDYIDMEGQKVLAANSPQE